MIFSIFLSSLLLTFVSCETDLNTFFNKFVHEQFKKLIRDNLPEDDPSWLTYLDASSTSINGLKYGNYFALGNFDECYNLENNGTYGKYCLGTIPITLTMLAEALKLNVTQKQELLNVDAKLLDLRLDSTQPMGYHIALCLPHTVSDDFSMDIGNTTSIFFYEKMCYSKAKKLALSDGAIATICILAIFLAIAVVSTAFDVFLFYSEKEPPHTLLVAFSFFSNGCKLLKSTKNPDQLLCLNGIKAISMMWVILGHDYYNLLYAPMYNPIDAINWQHDPANMLINGATVSVDTFLVCSGLVTVYTFLKSMDKKPKFNVIQFYLHRFLRLTPALAIMCLVHMYLLTYLGNGPLWNNLDTILGDPCRSEWWSTLLYIRNFVKGSCMPQAWYLSVDMQYHVLSPIVLYPLWRWSKATLKVLGILALAGCAIPFAIGWTKHMRPMIIGNPYYESFIKNYYQQSYTRFGPYVIGMILGYFLYKIKKNELRIKISKRLACCLWLIFLTSLVACVYGWYDLNIAIEEYRWGNALFLAFDRPAWAVAVCGVIFLCVSGYGHPVDTFLSSPVFQFLTKLSYSMYLVHYVVIAGRYAAMKNQMRFSNAAVFYVFWADFMFTLGISIVLCLLFESPITILDKYLFGHGTFERVCKDKIEEKPKV